MRMKHFVQISSAYKEWAHTMKNVKFISIRNFIDILNSIKINFKKNRENWTLGHCSEDKFKKCLLEHDINNLKMETCKWYFEWN